MCWASPKPGREDGSLRPSAHRKARRCGAGSSPLPPGAHSCSDPELAAQIQTEIRRFTAGHKTRSFCVFGGAAIRPQAQALARGTEILVATPGRLIDLMTQRMVSLGEVRHLVLDEADRLLDMGFIADIRRIVADLPRARQSLLFSATMSGEIAELANSLLKDPVRVEVTPEVVTVDAIEQGVYPVKGDAKPELLRQLLTRNDVRKAIVFTRTKHGADRVARRLNAAGIEASAIHGNKTQGARRKALEGFKQGKEWVLVATDIAARGIDVAGITHVINFELPHEPESYVHRIGRTARNGTTGVAWSLVEPAEGKQLGAIERLQRIDIPRLDAPEGFATVALQTQGATRRGGRSGGAGGARRAPPRAPRPRTGNGAGGHSKALAPRKKVAPKGGPRAKVVPRGSVVPPGKAGATRAAQAAGASPMAAVASAQRPRAQRNRPSAA